MKPMLELREVTLRFGMVRAAVGIDLRVGDGELVGLIGPNGAGKTTLLNLITGYLRPDGGEIRLLGQDIVGRHPDRITALGVGRSFQAAQLFSELTVLENMLVAVATAEAAAMRWWSPLRQDRRVGHARRVLDRFGLAADADTPAAQIAEGTRKLLDVAMAMALDPTLLLMDEPTSGVSIEAKFPVMDTLVAALREQSVTALFVEHDMDVVRRYADRVLVLSEGEIVADGAPDDVLGDEAVRRAVVGWA